MKRREFLGTMAATIAAATFGGPTFSFASGESRENILLCFLEGGADVFGTISTSNIDVNRILYGSGSTKGLRESLKIDDKNFIRLDPNSPIRLNNAFAPLYGVTDQIRLVMGTGIAYGTEVKKSHADCQLAAISGDLDFTSAVGILSGVNQKNRFGVLSVCGVGGNPIRDLKDKGDADGKIGNILNIGSFNNFKELSRQRFNYSCEDYQKTTKAVYDNFLLDETVQKIKALEHAHGTKFTDAFHAAQDNLASGLKVVNNYVKDVPLVGNYGVNQDGVIGVSTFGDVCKDVARYFTANFDNDPIQNPGGINPAVRLAQVRMRGFDTHKGQLGVLDGKLVDLAGSLRGLVSDLKAAGQWENTSIVVFSEFGRALRENGANGTDHGWGGMSMILSGKFSGSKVIGDITKSNLENVSHMTPNADISYHSAINEVFKKAGINFDNIIKMQPVKNIGLFD